MILPKHSPKILWKSKHFPQRYKRKREWVFISEHSVDKTTKTLHGLNANNGELCFSCPYPARTCPSARRDLCCWAARCPTVQWEWLAY